MEVNGQPHTLATSCLRKGPPVPIEEEVFYALELIWMFWRREKSLACARI
jgi:hypothetical protein